MKIALCFLTYANNDRAQFNYNAIIGQARNSKRHIIDVYTYIDYDNDYKIKDTEALRGGRVYFNYNYLQDKFNYHHLHYEHERFGTKCGVLFLPWLDMYVNHKYEYDMYIFYEYDVVYFGKDNMFDRIDFDCDTLFMKELSLTIDHKHWNWLNTPFNLDENFVKDHYYGLINVFGMNESTCEKFIEFINNGNYAFYEYLIPSFSMNLFPYNIHYISHYMNVFDTFNHQLPKRNNYELVHPVKSLEQYNKYLNNDKY